MPYNPLIPQATDLISVSQNQIQSNFQTMDNGTSGTGVGFDREHITVTDSTYGGMHIQATMPNNAALSLMGTPPVNTSFAPLGIPPAPAAGYGTYYATKTGTVGAAITQATYKSGDQNNGNPCAISILSAVKAWGRFNGTIPGPVAIVDGFNFGSIAGANGVYTITFATALPSAVYSVIATVDAPNFIYTFIAGATALATNQFTLNVRGSTGSAGSQNGPINFIVLQS
jgi:hypothetical protein